MVNLAGRYRGGADDTSLLDLARAGRIGSGTAAHTPRTRMLEALGVLDAATTLLSAPLLTFSARAAACHLHQAAAVCAAAADSRQFADLSYSFHAALVSCCPNQRMLELLAEEITLVRALLDHDAVPGPAELSQAAHEHALLLQLVETAPESPDITSLLRGHRQICY